MSVGGRRIGGLGDGKQPLRLELQLGIQDSAVQDHLCFSRRRRRPTNLQQKQKLGFLTRSSGVLPSRRVLGNTIALCGWRDDGHQLT